MKGTTQCRVPLPFPDRQAAGLLLGARLREQLGAQAGQEPLIQVREGPGGPVEEGPGGPVEEGPGGPVREESAAGPDAHRGFSALVLGLPRGGVAVGAEVARILGAPLDVLVTRKIGYPPRPELGLGAIAEGGEPVYDHRLLATIGLEPADLLATAEREREELTRRVRVYRGGQPPPDVTGRLIVLVDDGIATGVTARAALRAIRAKGAGRTILAVPVAPRAAVAQMMREADDVVVLASPAAFRSVGEWYVSFGQLSDADVLSLLARARARTGAL
jgi:putative phosphoribosyl transferase